MATILVADDEPKLGKLVVEMLESAGHQVSHVSGGRAAIEKIASAPPDIVLTDLRMPEMDGFALAAELASQGIGWPVLLMTSDNGPELARRAASQGIATVLRKPVDGAFLEEALGQAFARLEA